MSGRRGFVLVVVLVVVALLTSLTVLFINEVYLEVTAEHNARDAAQGSLFAQGGITGALQLLTATAGSQSYTTLNDLWAKPILLDEEQGELRIAIEDETGKLNLNMVSLPNGSFNEPYRLMALRLFTLLKLPPELVETLADWTDEGDTPHPNGAESSWYQSLKPPYLPRNSYLKTVDELALVKGFAGAPLQRIRPFVTVYGDLPPGAPAAPININTAPKEVLMALDERIGSTLADRIIVYRRDTPFKTAADLAQVPGMEGIAPSLLTRIATKGAVYRIRSEATVNGVTRTIEAVVRLGGASPDILYWREY